MATDGSGLPELGEAEEKLRAFGGWDWLLSGQTAWSVADVAEQLGRMMGGPDAAPSHDVVTRWFKTLPDTMSFGGLGLRASRNSLVRFFAARQINNPGASQPGAQSA